MSVPCLKMWKVWPLIALVAMPVLAEAILRFGFGLGNPVLIAIDPGCAYVMKANQDVWRFHATTKINRFGMRSNDFSEQRPSGTTRLLFVGDSMTYGTSRVDQNEIFTERLHRELGAIIGRRVEVLNASAGGWAPDNELSYLQSRGVFNSEFVLVVLNDGDLTQTRSTWADVEGDLPAKRPLTAIGEVGTRYVWPLLKHALVRAEARSETASQAVERGNLIDLDRMLAISGSQSARMILVYLPFPRDVPDESARAEKILHAWSDTHKVGMFDITTAESAYPAQAITLRDGVHLNAKGHRVVAQAIEQQWTTVVGVDKE